MIDTNPMLPPSTPEWVKAHIAVGPHGGWVHPLTTDAEHPLVVEGATCPVCEEDIKAGQVIIITPYNNENWAAYHREPCFLDCLGIERTRLLRFLSGSGKDGDGRRLHEVLAFTDADLEEVHSWVQWVFPLPEPSKYQSSPKLTAWDIKRLREDKTLQANVTKAVSRFLLFLASTNAWLAPRDHNHLRITRLLRFLTLIGLDDVAEHVYKLVTEAMRETGLDFMVLHFYWTEAKNLIPAWLAEPEVLRLRTGGMEDGYIARELVDDLFRATGISMHDEQARIEHLVRRFPSGG
jgi:hypothetical protein